jgi:hypothetical protein
MRRSLWLYDVNVICSVYPPPSMSKFSPYPASPPLPSRASEQMPLLLYVGLDVAPVILGSSNEVYPIICLHLPIPGESAAGVGKGGLLGGNGASHRYGWRYVHALSFHWPLYVPHISTHAGNPSPLGSRGFQNLKQHPALPLWRAQVKEAAVREGLATVVRPPIQTRCLPINARAASNVALSHIVARCPPRETQSACASAQVFADE